MEQDFFYDITWTITSYMVFFIVNNIEEPSLVSGGNRFNDELIRRINAASSGTVIVFYNIKAKSSAGERALHNIMVTIRN